MSAEAKNEQKDTFDDAFMAKGDGKFDDDVFSGGGEESFGAHRLRTHTFSSRITLRHILSVHREATERSSARTNQTVLRSKAEARQKETPRECSFKPRLCENSKRMARNSKFDDRAAPASRESRRWRMGCTRRWRGGSVESRRWRGGSARTPSPCAESVLRAAGQAVNEGDTTQARTASKRGASSAWRAAIEKSSRATSSPTRRTRPTRRGRARRSGAGPASLSQRRGDGVPVDDTQARSHGQGQGAARAHRRRAIENRRRARFARESRVP